MTAEHPGPLLIEPLQAAAIGTWAVPGSKSITNRALVLAALGQQPCQLSGMLRSDDTDHMSTGLRQLGVQIDDLDATTTLVTPGPLACSEQPLFVGNSGTTVRFLAAAALLIDGPTQLVGDQHMALRPITPLVEALQALGADVDCATGCPPLTVSGHGMLPAADIAVPGAISSQYFSAIAMAATQAAGPVQVRPLGQLVSRPYVEMTTQMICEFGGQASIDVTDQVRVNPGLLGRAAYTIEPDASTASYPLALAAATGGCITVPGLDHQAMQGDVGFIDVLSRMGARVTSTDGQLTVEGPVQLRGVDVDMHHISDTVMTLAAIAPLADSPTTIRNIANIRVKETDRLAALVNELQRLGQSVAYGDDWLRIEPRPVQPATIECYADHRIAMSFAILGLARPGVTIADPACVAKTYPGFWQDLTAFRQQQTSQH